MINFAPEGNKKNSHGRRPPTRPHETGLLPIGLAPKVTLRHRAEALTDALGPLHVGVFGVSPIGTTGLAWPCAARSDTSRSFGLAKPEKADEGASGTPHWC